MSNTKSQISHALMRALEEHTLSDRHHEVCGFVYADRYVPLDNVSPDPASFNAEPGKVAWALNRFGEPDAIFHSHTNGSSEPSARDIQLSYYYCNSTILIGVLASAGFSLFAWAASKPWRVQSACKGGALP